MRNTARRGLTLVEVIAAMLLFSVGALGLAATSAFIGRQIRLNNARSQNAITLRNHSERSIALGCTGIQSSQPVSCQ